MATAEEHWKLSVPSCSSPMRRQGSIRKVLHSTTEPVYGLSAKMVERSNQLSTPIQSYAPFFQEYAVIAEFNMVGDHLMPGLYVIPSARSGLVWYGVILVRWGPYEGGKFRFRLLLPETFPDSTPPRIIFEGEMFHPNVDAGTSELKLESRLSEGRWKKGVTHVWEALEYARKVMYNVDTSETPAANTEAFTMMEEDVDEFEKRARECAEASSTRLNTVLTDDPHYLMFGGFDESVHSSALQSLTSPKEPEGKKRRGLSWVKQGSLKTFSKLFH